MSVPDQSEYYWHNHGKNRPSRWNTLRALRVVGLVFRARVTQMSRRQCQGVGNAPNQPVQIYSRQARA